MKKTLLMTWLVVGFFYSTHAAKRKLTIQNAGRGYVDLYVYYADQRVCKNGPIKLEERGPRRSTVIYLDGECPLERITYKRVQNIRGNRGTNPMQTSGRIEKEDSRLKRSKIYLK